MGLALDGMTRPGILGDSKPWEDGVMNESQQYSPEVRERAVRVVFDPAAEHASQWAALGPSTEECLYCATTLPLKATQWPRCTSGPCQAYDSGTTAELPDMVWVFSRRMSA